MESLCSFCGKRKGDAKDWLLGFEGSKEKSVVMKYTITLLGKWDEERASQPKCRALLLHRAPEQLFVQELR